MEVEKNSSSTEIVRLGVEGEKGVFFFENNKSVGVVMLWSMANINSRLIERIITDFRGFSLALVTLTAVSNTFENGMQETDYISSFPLLGFRCQRP